MSRLSSTILQTTIERVTKRLVRWEGQRDLAAAKLATLEARVHEQRTRLDALRTLAGVWGRHAVIPPPVPVTPVAEPEPPPPPPAPVVRPRVTFQEADPVEYARVMDSLGRIAAGTATVDDTVRVAELDPEDRAEAEAAARTFGGPLET